MLGRLLRFCPQERMSVDEALVHPFLSDTAVAPLPSTSAGAGYAVAATPGPVEPPCLPRAPSMEALREAVFNECLHWDLSTLKPSPETSPSGADKCMHDFEVKCV